MARSHLIVAPLTTAEGVHRLADAIGGDVTPRTDVHNASLGRYLRRTPPAANLIAMRAGGGAARRRPHVYGASASGGGGPVRSTALGAAALRWCGR